MMKALHNLLLTGVSCTVLSVSSIAPAAADVPGYDEFGVAWTHTASSCAVDPQHLDKAAFRNADFSFQSQAFSRFIQSGQYSFYEPIVARCNVLNPLDADPATENPDWNALIVGYADPDGMGINTNVVAKLIRVSRPTGAVVTVATFNSDKSPSKNITTRHEDLSQFFQPLDFRNNEYYVELELIRTPLATQQAPVIYSVSVRILIVKVVL
jgi:hypothetical protein